MNWINLHFVHFVLCSIGTRKILGVLRYYFFFPRTVPCMKFDPELINATMDMRIDRHWWAGSEILWCPLLQPQDTKPRFFEYNRCLRTISDDQHQACEHHHLRHVKNWTQTTNNSIDCWQLLQTKWPLTTQQSKQIISSHVNNTALQRHHDLCFLALARFVHIMVISDMWTGWFIDPRWHCQ